MKCVETINTLPSSNSNVEYIYMMGIENIVLFWGFSTTRLVNYLISLGEMNSCQVPTTPSENDAFLDVDVVISQPLKSLAFL